MKTDYNLMLQDEELPTIMLGTVIDVEGLYEDGRICDLTDYLPEYAPDYWAYLNDNNLIDEVKSLDGRILTVNSDVCVITKSSTEEELITALKVLNYGFTEEGMHYWNFGEENVTFYYDEN